MLRQIGGGFGKDAFIPPDGGIIRQVVEAADQNQDAQQHSKPKAQPRRLRRLVNELHNLSCLITNKFERCDLPGLSLHRLLQCMQRQR